VVRVSWLEDTATFSSRLAQRGKREEGERAEKRASGVRPQSGHFLVLARLSVLSLVSITQWNHDPLPHRALLSLATRGLAHRHNDETVELRSEPRGDSAESSEIRTPLQRLTVTTKMQSL